VDAVLHLAAIPGPGPRDHRNHWPDIVGRNILGTYNVLEAAVRQGARLRVATKYVTATREHFAAKGVHVDLIRLYGSMELAPLVGLADAIVDLVATGGTLRANNLVAVEEIMPVSARLIVNQAALKTRRAELQPLIDAFSQAAPQ
jgi:ATP phosphoribosyltransferase